MSKPNNALDRFFGLSERNDPERYWVWTFFFLLLFFGVAGRDDTEKVGVGK